MSALRFSSLIILFPILFAACGRSELIRIRMLAPVTEDKKDYAIFTDTESTATPVIINKQIGGSLYILFKSIGLGYTTITTKMEKMTTMKALVMMKTNSIKKKKIGENGEEIDGYSDEDEGEGGKRKSLKQRMKGMNLI